MLGWRRSWLSYAIFIPLLVHHSDCCLVGGDNIWPTGWVVLVRLWSFCSGIDNECRTAEGKVACRFGIGCTEPQKLLATHLLGALVEEYDIVAVRRFAESFGADFEVVIGKEKEGAPLLEQFIARLHTQR